MTRTRNETIPERTTTGLRPNSLGVAGIVFFVVAAASPLSAVLGSSPAAIGAGTGAGAPSAYLLAGVLLLVFSVGYSAMSRHVASCGGFAAYVHAAFGERAGRSAGYLASVAYASMQAGLYAVFGVFASRVFGGVGLILPWYVWSLAAWLLCSFLGYRDIDLSAKVLGTVMILEVVVLLVVSFAVVLSGGAEGVNLTSFTPSAATGGSFGIAIMFAFASFIGFEATSIYSEEARNREKTIPRATYAAVAIITAFLVFTVWSLVIGWGVRGVQEAAVTDPDNFVFALAERYVGPIWAVIMMVLLISSFFAALLAFQNTVARYLRILALQNWLPAGLARTHPRHHSPSAASLATSLISVVLIIAFAAMGLDPYSTLFMWLVGLGTLSIIVLQTITSVAVIVYFRHNRTALSAWRTAAAPAVGALGLAATAALVVINWPVMVGATSGVSQFLPAVIPLTLIVGFLLPLAPHAAASLE